MPSAGLTRSCLKFRSWLAWRPTSPLAALQASPVPDDAASSVGGSASAAPWQGAGRGPLSAENLAAHRVSFEGGSPTHEQLTSAPTEQGSPTRQSEGGKSNLSHATSQALSFAAMRRGNSAESLPVAEKEELPPTKMNDKEKWAWKMNQLALETALKGMRKWGRERLTSRKYAQDAENAGEGTIADALR